MTGLSPSNWNLAEPKSSSPRRRSPSPTGKVDRAQPGTDEGGPSPHEEPGRMNRRCLVDPSVSLGLTAPFTQGSLCTVRGRKCSSELVCFL